MFQGSLFLALAMVVVSPTLCESATHIVKPDGTGDFPTIQAAVNAAVEFDIIELADGTFTGNGNRDIDYLEKPITIRSQSGNPESCIIDCDGSVMNQHRGFYLFGVNSSAVLEEITVRDGWMQMGGAIYLAEADLTIRNCIFENCWAQVDGGAIYTDLSSPQIEGCRFASNSTGGDGGAVFCQRTSTPRIEDCSFEDNDATWNGGGLYGYNGVTLNVFGSSFERNTCGYNGGGIGCYQSAHVWLYECFLSLNQAQNKGGGFCSRSGNRAIVELCTFDSNYANRDGGGMTCEGMLQVEVDTSVFRSNTSDYHGGAASFDDLDSYAIFWKSLLEGNHSARGGGIALHRHSAYRLLVDQSILSGNSCEVAGGAICAIDESSYSVRIEISGSTFYGNRGQHGSSVYASRVVHLTMYDSIVAFGVDGAAVFCEAGQPFELLSVGCSDVFGNEGGDWVGCFYGLGQNGNISMDPRLCDPEEGDFHLLGDSPCAPGTPPNPECDLIGALPVGCVPTAVPEIAEFPAQSRLSESWPNPFAGRTTIGYRLAEAGSVTLSIYDISGRVVRVLLDGICQEKGEHLVAWDGENGRGEALGSGMYLYRLEVGFYCETRPMILMR